jgi:hypothetical protein
MTDVFEEEIEFKAQIRIIGILKKKSEKNDIFSVLSNSPPSPSVAMYVFLQVCFFRDLF